MKILVKNFLLILFIFLTISALFSLFFQPLKEIKELSITQLIEDINQGKVEKITVSGDEIEAIYKDETIAKSKKEPEASLFESLINYGVEKEKLAQLKVDIKERGGNWSWLGPVLFSVLPVLLFGVFFWMLFRQAKSGAMQAFDFTKAKARLFGAEGHPKEKISFKDVAGQKEAKEELK